MKMKEFGPPGGRASLAPPLDLPMPGDKIFLTKQKSGYKQNPDKLNTQRARFLHQMHEQN